MIAILDSIAKNADPANCYNLNYKKAIALQQQMATLPPEQKPFAQFKYAEQMLYAGKPEAAIVEFTNIVQQFNDQLTPETKTLYELLAVSYLRLGEVENCVEKGTSESCIVPIAPGGFYSLPSGPESAIKIYERILTAFPDDLQSKWLINIAYMNLGKWPAGVPNQFLISPELFKKNGDWQFKNIAPELGLNLKAISGGICFEDFDNDNDLDLFFTAYGLTDQCRYFVNNADGTFTEKTKEANLTGLVSGLNVIQADYDNDGDKDILILRGAWLEGGTHPNSLLQNDGTGRFTDVTIDAGLLSFHPTQAAGWADYDGDGWLDLYIANETRPNPNGINHPNELYHNNGNGTFTNVAKDLKLNAIGFFKGAVWGDINNDQRPDLYLSNLNGDNRLFVNRGGTAPNQWNFEDISVKAGVTNPQSSFPTWFFDFNNDGLQDILVVGYLFDPGQQSSGEYLSELMGAVPKGDVFRLYKNNGNETFTDVHNEMGLQKTTFAMGSNFGDFDNDGWMDFYLGTGKPDLRALVPNRMFRNIEGRRFEEITMNGFAAIQKGHGVAVGDLNNDGDVEIFEQMGGAYEGDFANSILFDQAKNMNSWVEIILEGKTCARDAIGAQVAVVIKEKSGKSRTIYANCGSGGSFGAGSHRMEIGLGSATEITRLVITWPKPGVPKSTYTNVPLNKIIKITEGNPEASAINIGAFKLGKQG